MPLAPLRFKFSRHRSDLGGGDSRSLYSLLRVTDHSGNRVVTFAVFHPWDLKHLDVRRVFREEARRRHLKGDHACRPNQPER